MRKPLTGAILGILIGVAIAVFLQRQGIWPLDQLTLFLLPAATGLAGLLLLSIGRAQGSMATLIVSLIILLPMAVWGALGISQLNEQGELNGGCEVAAESAVDSTVVTDTSRGDPFEIDPDGGLIWAATSPTVFMDYEWSLDVVIGGISVPLDSGTEPNEGGSQVNGGDVADIRLYAEERGINVDLLTGVYEVGGFAATCDGFGFVKLLVDGVDPVAMIALGVALVLLIVLIVLMFTGRGKIVETTATVVAESTADPGAETAGPGAADAGPPDDSSSPGSVGGAGADDENDTAGESGMGRHEEPNT